MIRDSVVRSYLMEYYGSLCVLFVVLLIGVVVFALGDSSIGGVFIHLWLGVLYAVFITLSVLPSGMALKRILSNGALVWFGWA